MASGTDAPAEAETMTGEVAPPLPLSEAEPAPSLRDLNDTFRTSLRGGLIVLTTGVRSLPKIEQQVLLQRVQDFTAFDEGNDPYSEHDFGTVELGDDRYFWKIDYFDHMLEATSPDPLDPAQTTRVLTVMRVEEY